MHPLRPPPGAVVLLVSADRKPFICRILEGDSLHTHQGVVSFDEVLATPWGAEVASHTGARFTLLRPSLEEVLRNLQRSTQIMYPKDIGYVLLKLGIVPGTRVIEAGTGSGALTVALATYVMPEGRVYSYDVRPDHIAMAARNLERLGLSDAVELVERDVAQGFDQRDVDALFLDVREPWSYLDAALEAMSGAAFLGSLVPTINQVVHLVDAMSRRDFTGIEVCELLLRQYRAVPQRIRPQDRLTAHTGFLVFARKRQLSEAGGSPGDTTLEESASQPGSGLGDPLPPGDEPVTTAVDGDA